MPDYRQDNPFEVTKAVDFTDREIRTTFVDLPTAEGGFGSIVDPRSPMPHFITGGKGGGRTHLMRHLSYALQTLDISAKVAKVRGDGYIGVYFRCSGLNASRFSGKRQSSTVWSSIFAYYMDLWLLRLIVEDLIDLAESSEDPWTAETQRHFQQAVQEAFDGGLPPATREGLRGLVDQVSREIRTLDRAVNNAALRPSLDIDIKAAPGAALFEIVRLVVRDLLPGIRITFLIDELENLRADQQRYVNTLVREKVEDCTFIIGSRAEGLRTFETLSAGEVNKAGSEYDITTLEDVYSSNRKAFRRFCTDVVVARMREVQPMAVEASLKRLFPANDADPDALTGAESRLRPHLVNLRSSLKPVIRSDVRIDEILDYLAVAEDPLEEKLRILRFYQRWSSGTAPTPAVARAVRDEFLEKDDLESARVIRDFWKGHRSDMLAQLYVESGQKVPYAGFDQFLEMAGYLPRSLLVILKSTIRWAQFLGESPLMSGNPISVRAQTEGVRDAAEWFLKDSARSDTVGMASAVAIRRLGGYLRRMRYSDKPVEVDCAAFSTDRRGLSVQALDVLDDCVSTGLLLEIPRGQIDRNSGAFHHKYQLNPMLAPHFDLPTSRRGVAKIAARELNAIFDPDVDDEGFDRLIRERIATLNAPFVATMEGQDVLFD
ncbi:ORC-CDC6 family AAA ATPase [Cellulomonas oligotrophica]|uniref:Uncharacterized protein n=2 Tax=Cellulomonas oligotrophica TaxID=931536 RepID=A0A7Y9FHH0_9CELL|nr:hypothetical protein [Cellulomonas oligotrophica]NYD87345.1 hypothetical protein [Cellulomonas oligotrophica]GIG34264.1 hypothetical protein Col01nite_34230 [Cellulomonas oligotrophica]